MGTAMSRIAPGASRTTKPANVEATPPLRNGDQLTVAECHRRYLAMPHLKKAELIEGVVSMPSPVSFRRHSKPDLNLITWSGVYDAHTPGVSGGTNPTLRVLVGESEPQPDSCLRIEEEFGGRSWIDEEDYLTGSPE
jgi:hypothetical protein